MSHLTCYRLRRTVAGLTLDEPGDYVDKDKRTPATFQAQGAGFRAELHVLGSYPAQPRWARFFDSQFEPAIQFPNSSSVSALLIVFLDTGERFAFTFGPSGRFLLQDDVMERTWGRRVALNLVYPLGTEDLEELRGRIRSADTKRVSHNVSRVRRQFVRNEDLLAFDIDQDRDLLRGITGTPHDTTTWGNTVTGGDSFCFKSTQTFAELASLCRDLADEGLKKDCDQLFPWIDRLRAVQDVSEREAVNAALLAQLQEGSTDLQLSPPEIIDWSRVSEFHFQGDGPQKARITRYDLELRDYLALERTRGSDLTVERLKARKVFALDGDGQVAGSWSVWRCLSGSVALGDRVYVLDDGDAYEVSSDFLGEIEKALGRIPESSVNLPRAQHGQNEGPYNETCAAASDGELLLLDRKLVNVLRSTSRIEVCDLLSRNRQMVHVKSAFHSSTLSHLFNQGLVSAEALMQPPHREAVLAKMDGNATQHRQLFSGDFNTRDWEVTWAIIGAWKNRSLHDALPFFSRVTLKYAAQSLDQLGFKVTYKAVDRELPPRRKAVREVT